MNNSKAEELYNFLLESEELLVFYPELTGDWEKDKKKFIRMFEENEGLIDDEKWQ